MRVGTNQFDGVEFLGESSLREQCMELAVAGGAQSSFRAEPASLSPGH